MAIEELRKWRTAPSGRTSALGIRSDDNTHVVTKTEDNPLQPRNLTHVMSDFLKESGMNCIGCDTVCQPPAGSKPSTRNSFKNALAIPALRSPWTSIATPMPNMQGETVAKLDVAFRGPLIRRGNE